MEDPHTASQDRSAAEVRAELVERAGTARASLLELQPLIARLGRSWAAPESGEELAALLDGDWRLLYASKPALASSGLDAFVGVTRTRTYQCIDAAAGRVWNLAELGTPFGLMGTVLVRARFVAETPTRVRVHFEQTALVWGGLSPYGLPREVIRHLDGGEGLALRLGLDNTGTLETLYADSEVRIGLGNRGTIFVLRRE
jgi:hypothetical protein